MKGRGGNPEALERKRNLLPLLGVVFLPMVATAYYALFFSPRYHGSLRGSMEFRWHWECWWACQKSTPSLLLWGAWLVCLATLVVRARILGARV